MRTPDIIKALHIFTALVLCCGTVSAAVATECLQQAIYTEDIEGDVAAALAGCDEMRNAAEKIEDDLAAVLADREEVLEDVPASSD